MNDSIIVADELKLRAVLSETGLPAKVTAELNYTERKLHLVLCGAYNFAVGKVEADIPYDVMRKCGKEFTKLWNVKPVAGTMKQNKTQKYVFEMTEATIKTTIKTVLNKDQGVFKATINKVQLNNQWSKYLKPKTSTTTPSTNVDWKKAEMQAKRFNEHTKEQILDGKTFNAQKDNPWARKNLKKRPE